jgi:opacity protein-like surface antigen
MSKSRMKMRQGLLIFILIANLALFNSPTPAQAGFHPQLDFINMLAWPLAFTSLSVAAHYMYENSPAERVKYPENLGLGEWYFGGYLGLSYLPSSDWGFFKFPSPYQGHTAKNIIYQAGPQVGLKFGRFFDTLPWFGLEVEWSFSRNDHRAQNITITPPLPNGKDSFLYTTDWFMAWAMQVNMLARYGLLKDKEVPAGRLQPYVGLGPGFEIVYGKTDSFKNFAIETLAGIRYMCTKNIGIFCEYKFSYQFSVEYENALVDKQQLGTMTFDFPHHRFVVGVTYHFKNLYGN